MKIFLDMDGIIADFVSGACKVLDRTNPYFDPKHWGNWDIVECLKMEDALFWDATNTELFWASLPKMPDADKIVEIVTEAFGVENICILSSPTRYIRSLSGKLYWLQNNYPQFARSFLFGSRKQFCAGGDKLLIDDSDANVDSFTRAGGNAILVPRPWNANYIGSSNAASILQQEIKCYL